MASKKKVGRAGDAALLEVRAFGLAYPGAHTKSPWPGHLDLAVKDKTFAYLSLEGQPFSISCKLPQSAAAALMLPFTTPTGYGLGKSGWVSASFPDGDIPIAMLKEWIDESYRAQAPKKLVASLAATAAAAAASPANAKAARPAKRAKAAKPVRSAKPKPKPAKPANAAKPSKSRKRASR